MGKAETPSAPHWCHAYNIDLILVADYFQCFVFPTAFVFLTSSTFCFRMNYMTALLQKISKMEKTINVFNSTIMQGKIGVVKNVQLPSLEGNRFFFFLMKRILFFSQ